MRIDRSKFARYALGRMTPTKSYSGEFQRTRVAFLVATVLGYLGVASHSTLRDLFALRPVASVALGFGVLWLMLVFALLAKILPLRHRGLFTLRDEGLFAGNRLVIEQRNIREILFRYGEPKLVIREVGLRMFTATTIKLDSPAEAHALFTELVVDETQNHAEYTLHLLSPALTSGATTRVVLPTIALAVAFGIGIFLAPITFEKLSTLALFPMIWPALFFVGQKRLPRVRVGADGLSIFPGRGPTRFVSYHEVNSVTRHMNQVVLHLASNERITCTAPAISKSVANLSGDTASRAFQVSLADALLERIENARALFGERVARRAHLVEVLKRNDRTIEQWRDAATSLSQQRYRVAATSREILEDIVQSGSLAPDVRVGAALALSADEGARVRLDHNTSVVPELDAAIDAALDGDDATLERAMTKMKID